MSKETKIWSVGDGISSVYIENEELSLLIEQCYRILTEDGLLIMETPSIDNLIVSTKTFYIDHTHINPINPDSISFLLEKSGFSNVKYYYINGGPLQDAHPLKFTRIFNGISSSSCSTYFPYYT